MFGRPDDKNHGPDPFASQEVLKREREEKEAKKNGHLSHGTGDAKGTATTNELDIKTPLKKHDLSYDKQNPGKDLGTKVNLRPASTGSESTESSKTA